MKEKTESKLYVKRKSETCLCDAYNFPHRVKSGKCANVQFLLEQEKLIEDRNREQFKTGYGYFEGEWQT